MASKKKKKPLRIVFYNKSTVYTIYYFGDCCCWDYFCPSLFLGVVQGPPKMVQLCALTHHVASYDW